eukprot:6850622-Heterocapsa_arctica.AAC.1
MLAWIRARLDPKRSRNDAAVWAAMTLGFFFLRRASEYVEPGAGKEKCLRISDVKLLKNGQAVKPGEPPR